MLGEELIGRHVRFLRMPKEPVTPPHPANPEKLPLEEPRLYKDPVEPQPGNPQEYRPAYDPPATFLSYPGDRLMSASGQKLPRPS
jgi:hypothetical protein